MDLYTQSQEEGWIIERLIIPSVYVSMCAYILLTVYSLSSDPSQSDSDSKDFWFNMQALTSYLRKASDQNPSASYYNVDILKYQVSQPALGLEHNRDKNYCS